MLAESSADPISKPTSSGCTNLSTDIILGVLSAADGSARFNLGHSAVLACVNGPDQVRNSSWRAV